MYSFLFLGIRTSIPVILCCCVVIFGFYIGADGEINFSLIGTIFGVMSSLFVSLNSIYTKKMISIVDNNSWKLCFYVMSENCCVDFQNNTNSIFLFIPLIIFFERDIIIEHISAFKSLVFWGVMNAAGVFGFLIGIITIAQISLTSPLTHNISGTAKACVQTLVAVIFLGDKMSLRSAIGTFCVLGGTFMYSLVRSHEMDREKAKKQADAILNVEKPVSSEEKEVETNPLLPTKNEEWCVCFYTLVSLIVLFYPLPPLKL